MAIVKRLYLFILKSFIPLFAMTFLIVLFIVLMQFLWKNIDDLVGKGLGIGVIGELFFYAALTMVPLALPLAILLASLMTFGNFGEKFELTAMKASGISLIKAMSPLLVLVAAIAVGAFYFQNNVMPYAQVKMYTLLFSMRQKSPELEIPEGVFYDQIPGYNLFVQSKDRESGMLHDLMIYDVSRGGDNSTILVADSGKLAFTADMRYLYLHLYEGEQFENLREQRSMDRNVPFRREDFAEKEVLIPFDANFNRLDEAGMRSQYVGKNMTELNQTIDSVGQRLDSIGGMYARDLKLFATPLLTQRSRYGTMDAAERTADSVSMAEARPVDVDTLVARLSHDDQVRVYDQAISRARSQNNDLQFKALTIQSEKFTIRRHEIELLKKFTLSVACLVFFFIGAPLGAIIRKGGLGTPLVISVLLFLVYYIIDNTGYKMARDGHWLVWAGIWLSTFILAPLGIYVTWKAMNDSAVFDADRYKAFFTKALGLKAERMVRYKEVIINEISLPEALERLRLLAESARGFNERYTGPQGYRAYWMQGYDKAAISGLSAQLEQTVEYLTDCRNPLAVNKLMDYPVVRDLWIYNPRRPLVLSRVLMWLVPLGAVIWLVGRRAQRNLRSEMARIATVSDTITDLLRK